MNAVKANRLYLTIILLTMALIVVVTVLYITDGFNLSIVANNFVSEMVSFLPALAFVLLSGDRLSELVPFKLIHIATVALIPVVLVLIFPMISVINAASMLFTDNEVLGFSGQIISEPVWKMLLSIGIFGPFVEEFVFRGVFYHTYRRTGRIIASALLSALLFGVMHMNFNQAMYAFFIGIVFAVMVEATGSVLTTFLAHAIFNSFEVVLMYAQEWMQEGALAQAQEVIGSSEGRGALITGILVLIIPALASTAIAFVLIYVMSRVERRPFPFRPGAGKKTQTNVTAQDTAQAPTPYAIEPQETTRSQRLVTPSLVIALVIAFANMTASLFLTMPK